MTELLPLLVPALATALLHFLWQGAAIGVLAWLTLSLLRHARPQARYAVACAALAACALLPAWSVVHALSGAGAGSAVGALVPDAGAAATPLVWLRDAGRASVFSPASPWIVALWACGAGLFLLRMACGLAWVRRLRAGSHADDGRWQACVDRLADRLRLGRRVALRIVDAGDGPVCAGWWRPVVLLPAAIAARMPAELLEALLAHELAHVRRHDYLVNLLQGAVEALLFYHPVVWWLSHRVRIERELVADDLAADALGEPRRLALALAELDRFDAASFPVHLPLFAHAARGGHLMSRIQQLVRPDRRAAPGVLFLPVVALVVAGVVFHAHARLADAPPAAAEQTASSSTEESLPAPVAAAVDSDPKPAISAPVKTLVARHSDEDGYALVRKGRDGFAMSGTLDDVDAIRAARDAIDDDFLWFRRDGKAWVLRDADALSRARAAWKDTDALDQKMRALDARMRPHSERMETLGRRMDALAAEADVESPEMGEASRRIEALSRQIQAAAQQQAALSVQQMQPDLGEARQRQLEGEMREQQAKLESLERQMEVHSVAIEAASERMRARHEPMEALGREMEAAGKPMEAIGKEMEVLGGQIERQAAIAEVEIRRIIDDAYGRGLATPAPAAH